ncbi:aldehyde dehydrogenase (NADP(+)) [Diaminobutyricibacter tongyongensis]|uniref:Aldehyde dehydrogenase (NADP(+)) n=1 Tax=Leifsonia tongyongensis TaxID=1268043 RepID=A0A6L9Y2H2_9MICO|nr:aldehyde dehydrogenase (NADP(+)) [Diaminobutyricibacter tongyongensis]
MSSVDVAANRAAESGFGSTSRVDRARWLEALADALEADRTALVAVAHRETHLSEARLDGEVTRTASQLRFFAGVAREGSYLEATLDSPDPTTIPPRPDLRRMLRPIGPVAVFTASNFPFAFSVLGNDTASALAAGCPVVVKAHPGHPELSRLTADLAVAALAAAGAPDGAFSLVEGVEAGVALVQHPSISAVGFTGSVRGGRALFDLVCARPAPIPFYGELGSINPVVITAAAARSRAVELASGLVGSFTRDGGQYCTKPGLVFVPAGTGFEDALAELLADAPAQRLLTDGMSDAFAQGAASLAHRDDVEVIGTVRAEGGGAGANAGSVAGTGIEAGSAPVVVIVDAPSFLASSEEFLTERFGPLTVVVRYADDAELAESVGLLEGSLTATIQHAPDEDVAVLADALSRIAGRVVFNGWPTGVAIAWAQHHGGSWPATTASIHSSVGATAIRRFLVPLAYQNAPASVLPPELRDGNPLGIPRRENA